MVESREGSETRLRGFEHVEKRFVDFIARLINHMENIQINRGNRRQKNYKRNY